MVDYKVHDFKNSEESPYSNATEAEIERLDKMLEKEGGHG